jgi:hypothetical protein
VIWDPYLYIFPIEVPEESPSVEVEVFQDEVEVFLTTDAALRTYLTGRPLPEALPGNFDGGGHAVLSPTRPGRWLLASGSAGSGRYRFAFRLGFLTAWSDFRLERTDPPESTT